MESTKTLDQSTDLPVVVSADRSSEQMTAERDVEVIEKPADQSPEQTFRSPEIRQNPYAEFTGGCRGGNINDLNYDNVTIEDLDRTSSAGGAARAFISRDERTVSLVVGVVEEGIWRIKQAIACAEISFQATMFPIPGTEWRPHASDVDVYGIEANNQPRAYMLTIILDEGFEREQLPEVGCRAQFFVSIAQHPHKVPETQLSTDQIIEAAGKLQDHFAAATSKAANELAKAQRKLNRLKEREADEEEIEKQRTVTESVYESTYMEHATTNVYGYVSRISDHVTLETPNTTDDVRRWIQAQLIVEELRSQPEEDEIAHLKRIQTWLRRQRNIIRPVLNQRQDEPWNGFRVHLPAGVREDIALFYVDVPLQVDWPSNFRQPPFIVDAPRKVPLHLGAYFANITRGEKNIFARIEYDVNDKPLRCEANAINLMNNVKDDSPAAEWWEYILAFNPGFISQELDLWEIFPGIADGAASGRFVGQNLEAAHKLKKTNQGKVIIAGGPGSGKTCFGTLIAQAVVEGGIMDTSPAPITSAATMTWAEMERQLNEQISALRKALVVWTAPQNAQVLDATIRLHKAIPGSIIIRVHLWKAEVVALLDAGVRIPKLMEPGHNATATERTIARLVNRFHKNEFKKHSPAASSYSISSQLRARAMADPDANWALFEILQMAVDDPVCFRTNRSEFIARVTRIMEDFVRSASILVGTPVAIKTLFDHMSSDPEVLRPDLIINDDADRSTEAMALVPLAMFPETPTLWLGDGKRLSSMTKAAFSSAGRPLFQDQRGMSLLKRAQDTGNADFTF